MSFSARLEDLELSSVLHLIALNRNSGRLVLTRSDSHALLVFREGRIIYAATNAVRQTFGSILLLRGLVAEDQLTAALERQHSFSEHRRLGPILVEMGSVTEAQLRDVMKEQTQGVVGELMGWKTGFFKFDPMDIVAGGEIEVDTKEFLVTEGFDTAELMLHAAARFDEMNRDRWNPAPNTAPPTEAPAQPQGAPLRTLEEALADHRPAVFGGEIALKLMRYAAQIVNRGVLFLVRGPIVSGIGQFGIAIEGETAAERVRSLEIPRAGLSLFANVITSCETYRGPMPHTEWNDYLVERLGGDFPREVVLVPMVVSGTVMVLFYGDNVPKDEGIGPTEGIEFLMLEAARDMTEEPATRRTSSGGRN
jgi:hypothetical protein